jgi:4a-hydroxytetrahydrobiopterin dehydratase
MGDVPDLTNRKCVPCEGDEQPLSEFGIRQLLDQVPGWEVSDQPRLRRTFEFIDFKGAMRFVNSMADVAESEGHHPDFFVHWNQVRVELWTHATGGLHQNDFIMAAKIERLAG